MKLRTLARDCLYLNWALLEEQLPEAPEPLRYEVHEVGGERYVFASALLFRHQGMRLAALPALRLSYPQLNFRLYVQDGDGIPSVLFRRMLVPVWALPGGWLVRQPVAPARFDFPRGPLETAQDDGGAAGGWRWRVSQGGSLAVAARQAAPRVGAGPRFTSWEAAVSYFRHRPRGYSLGHGGLHRIETQHPRVNVWPMAAEVLEASLLERCLSLAPWPDLHSAFLCPEIPFLFELSAEPEVAHARRSAAAVAADPAMLSRSSKLPSTEAA